MLKNTILAQNATPQPSFYILTKAEFRKSTKIKIYIEIIPNLFPLNYPMIRKFGTENFCCQRCRWSVSIGIPFLVLYLLRLCNPVILWMVTFCSVSSLIQTITYRTLSFAPSSFHHILLFWCCTKSSRSVSGLFCSCIAKGAQLAAKFRVLLMGWLI